MTRNIPYGYDDEGNISHAYCDNYHEDEEDVEIDPPENWDNPLTEWNNRLIKFIDEGK